MDAKIIFDDSNIRAGNILKYPDIFTFEHFVPMKYIARNKKDYVLLDASKLNEFLWVLIFSRKERRWRQGNMSILAPGMSTSQVQIQLNYGCYIYISFEVVQGYHLISHLAGILYFYGFITQVLVSLIMEV